MSSPELQFDPSDLPGSEAPPAPGSAAALKQQVADRLAAHRSKRGRRANSNLIPIPNIDAAAPPSPNTSSAPATNHIPNPARKSPPKAGKSRTDRIASAVAERYAHSTTYRDFLAAEAERAIAQANATAEIAARNAKAVTAVQQQLLAELDLWDTPTPSQPEPAETATARVPHSSPSFDRVPHSSPSFGDEWDATIAEPANPQPATQPLATGLTVRLYEDFGLRQPELRAASAAGLDEDEAHALDRLDHEIAFRHTPVFDDPAGPPVPIPANLIEFPRQLVAARKARPRIAEGPLREEADSAPSAAQLRIFEVDAAQFSSAPAAEPETSLPEWSSIHLDATPLVRSEARADTDPGISSEAQLQSALYVPIQVAPLGHRLMAAAVDACLLGAAFLAAVSAFACAVKSIPTGPIALIASAATLVVLFVLYHMLFFTFSCSTPGMKYARIGLCTFSDDNPTRVEMRRRIWFVLLAACPLGLGVLWALLDEDTLGWHDRLSRIYQRSY